MSQPLPERTSLSWDAVLNMAIVEVGLISDAKMYLFFEKGMRGRICYVSKRYGNNKYLNSCDPNT